MIPVRRPTRILAIAITLAITVSAASTPLGAFGVGAVAGVQESNSDGAATAVSQCKVIDEAGRYELTTDLETDASTCIEIQAANVTLDGNDYSVTSTDGHGTGILVRAGFEPPVEKPANASVTNLTVAQWDDGIRFESGDNGTIEGVAAVNASIELGPTAGAAVADSRVVNAYVTAGMGANDVTVRDSTLDHASVILGAGVSDALVAGVDGDAATVRVVQSEHVTVRDNALEEVYLSDVDHVTVADNRPGDAGRFGVWIASAGAGNVTVTGNVVTGNTEDSGRSTGVRAQSVHNLTVTRNTITGNEHGVVVLEITDREVTSEEMVDDQCVESTRTIEGSVEVHENSLGNNARGVVNEDSDVVNAVNNYWGDESGPSSAASRPLEDPRTGELADGSGASVSEHPDESGVSNVRFDPWFDDEPSSAPNGTETASN